MYDSFPFHYNVKLVANQPGHNIEQNPFPFSGFNVLKFILQLQLTYNIILVPGIQQWLCLYILQNERPRKSTTDLTP